MARVMTARNFGPQFWNTVFLPFSLKNKNIKPGIIRLPRENHTVLFNGLDLVVLK